MKIDEVISLWNKSKYETLMIKSLPCINHLGELTYGTGVYTKGQTIMCCGEYSVEDYLMKIYDNGNLICEKCGTDQKTKQIYENEFGSWNEFDNI